jgi:hypothetical protein
MNILNNRPQASAAGLAACALALALSGCNSGGSDSSPASSSGNNPPPAAASNNATGVFLDAPVQGLRVEHANGLSTTTGTLGEFQYSSGESLTFYLGAMKLGTVQAKTEITPLDLFATSDSNNRKVVNLLRLLQALDNNDNPADGIQLNDATLQAAVAIFGKLSLDQDSTLFEKSADVSAILAKKRPGLTLPGVAAAQAHFSATRQTAGTSGLFNGSMSYAGQSYAVGGMSGFGGMASTFNGSFSGSDKRSYTVMLNQDKSNRGSLQLYLTKPQVVDNGAGKTATINVPDVRNEAGSLSIGAGVIRFSGDNGTSLVLNKTAAAALTGVKSYYYSFGKGTLTLCPNGAFIASLPGDYGITGRMYIGLAYFGANGLQYSIKPLLSLGNDETISGALKLSNGSIQLSLPGGKLDIGAVDLGSSMVLDNICPAG